ncbi:MAG: ester cyclase [Candidatus Promineifilaceae bacterium]
MSTYQEAKSVVRGYFEALEKASPDEVLDVLKQYTSDMYRWRGVYPFREQHGIEAVADNFWKPLKNALRHMQRRPDIFIGGDNEVGEGIWVMCMGNFMGVFDEDWLDIPKTRRIATLRFAEFNRVENGKITETGIFVDVMGLMVQAGAYPLPPSTGVFFNYPGPRTHDGLLYEDAPAQDGVDTLALVNRMIEDLTAANVSGSMGFPADALRKTWAEDMIWYGPAGIGASMSIDRYQEQHQLPFRNNLDDKVFNGHVCRFAEGDFACFFGWPNLSNRPIGNFLGLPASGNATMQVVDVYRREGDMLAENWVLIDLIWWLKQQGLDVLERNRYLRFGRQ